MNKTNPPIKTTNYHEFLTPGVQIDVSPDDAENLGAFEELALPELDAWESNADLIDQSKKDSK